MKKKVCFFLVLALTALISCSEKGDPILPDVRSLVWASGTELPEASDFVVSQPEGVTVSFADSGVLPSKNAIGLFEIPILFRYDNRQEVTLTVELELISDTEPPELVGVKDLSCVIGEGLSYLSGVSATDNCDGKVKISVNSSEVNLTAEGHYSATYIATDAAGNRSEKTIKVSVYRQAVTEEMLYAEIESAIGGESFVGRSKQEICRVVYDFVYDNVRYLGTSDKSDWVRAAYDGLTNGGGDCFTYFALSKAFFNLLGVETLDVCRSPEAVEISGERHYWNMVNIGTDEEPEWYHFDACHMADMPKTLKWGFLMTDAQLAADSHHRVAQNGATDYFYRHDEGCPATATTVITAIPEGYLK